MFCQYCGAQLPEGALFCSNCGKQLNEKDRDQVAADPIVPAEAAAMAMPSGADTNPAGKKTGLSKGKKIGIGVAIGVVILVALMVFLVTYYGVYGGASGIKKDVGDGRFADGKKTYRYAETEDTHSLELTNLTITPTSEGMVAEFYLENKSSEDIMWGYGTPGRIVLETYDGKTYTSDSAGAYPCIPAGETFGYYQIFFKNAKGMPKTLKLMDLTSTNPIKDGFYTYSSHLNKTSLL